MICTQEIFVFYFINVDCCSQQNNSQFFVCGNQHVYTSITEKKNLSQLLRKLLQREINLRLHIRFICNNARTDCSMAVGQKAMGVHNGEVNIYYHWLGLFVPLEVRLFVTEWRLHYNDIVYSREAALSVFVTYSCVPPMNLVALKKFLFLFL